MAKKNEYRNYTLMDTASAVSLRKDALLDDHNFRSIIAALTDADRRASTQSIVFNDYLFFQRFMLKEYGDLYNNVHIGRSRQDILITCQRMNLRTSLIDLLAHLSSLRAAILQFAQDHLDDVVPSFTNGVQAQISTVGHIFSGYEIGFARIARRIFDIFPRMNTCPLGSAAIAGTSIPLDRGYLSELLGFETPSRHTFDAAQLSPIGMDMEVVGIIEAIALTVGLIDQDIHGQYHHPRPWYVLDGKNVTQPSTLMPQKRNPVALNHIRMDASRVLGSCASVRFIHHNAASGLTDHKREDSWEALNLCCDLLDRFTHVISQLKFDSAAAVHMINSEYSAASEVANYLFLHSHVPFKTGHSFTSKLVDYCRLNQRYFHELENNELDEVYRQAVGKNDAANFPLRVEEFRGVVHPSELIKKYSVLGGAHPSEVRDCLAHGTSLLDRDDIDMRTLKEKEQKWPVKLSDTVTDLLAA